MRDMPHPEADVTLRSRPADEAKMAGLALDSNVICRLTCEIGARPGALVWKALDPKYGTLTI